MRNEKKKKVDQALGTAHYVSGPVGCTPGLLETLLSKLFSFIKNWIV